MSNIKDLFNGKKSERVLENATQRSVGTSVESADYLKENVKQKQRFIPHVDFASASNFAIYGSAEKYYEDSYNYILNEYPYDGSFREKISWNLSGTYLDRYIFESEYPRTTGYVNMGQSYGFASQKTLGYDASSKNEWIYFKGNNTNSAQNTNVNPNLAVQFDNLNVYNTASAGLYNVELEGSGGASVEFWLRKPSFNSSNESRRQVVVDIWNSGTFGTPGYGRFRVEISGTDGNVVNPNFHVELLSGSSGYSSITPTGESPTVVLSGSILTGSWNHFALTFVNTGSQMTGRLYTNGHLSYTHVAGTSIGTVTGSMLGQIGSLVSTVSGSGALKRGYAKLSASLDEFRFWKKRQTDKEISQYWFSQVGGGTNTDITLATSASTKYSYENPVDLGVYYKFNEGIINTSSINRQDALVLDYAGRVTNGRWEGYSLTSRNTGSAIMSASAASYEFEDPILYASHPLVSTSLNDKRNLGKLYDVKNNSSMFGSLPRWITDDDENNSNSALKNLTQIMSSYFDTLYLQTQAVSSLKDKTYISGTNKPFPFSNRFIDSSGFLTTEIFTKASDLEYLDARNDKKLFTEKVDELKNLIYQNVYNNLIHVYKTKGTMKSFRNLIRCFGVDSELINVRLYGDQVTHKLLDNYDNAVVRKRYANFHTEYNMDAVVYQQTASSNSYSRGYISSSAEVQHRGNTYELETFFPPDYKQGTGYYFNSQFTTASLFGCHTSGAAGSTAWGAPDYGQFQVQTVRPDIRRSAAYFQLTCSNDGLGPFPQLTSSVFQDVYEGSRWNLAVRVKPKKSPFAAGVTGSSVGQYDLEFSGYNYVLDILNNSFLVTASVSATNAQRFLKSNKRFFVGAHRTNTTGTILQKSNVKSTSLRVWMDYLRSSTLVAHAKDTTNFGTQNPYRDAYLNEEGAVLGSKNVKAIPQLETLVMNWDFATVTGSDAAGNFTVQDVSIASSGSNDYSSRWGWLGPIGQYQHTGKGYGFLTNSTSSIDQRYVNTLIQQPPEVVNSSDMVSLIDADKNRVFSKDSRPEQYFFAFEKSMYNIISKEIIDIFGTIVDFNNLIGQPVNRYRAEYKDMQKLRQLYFERVQNNVDLDKFVEYFKWLDSSLSVMLQQLVPGSARFSENLRTMVESHVLERNKYQSKFPTLEMKQSDPEAGVFGINEMLYSGKRGTAPIPTTATGSNCEWWLERANRNNTNITSGDASVNAQRNIVRLANDFRSGSGPTLAVSRNSTATTTTYEGQAYAIRNFTKIYRLDVGEQPIIHGGSNFAKNKTVEYTHESLKFGSSEQLTIAASSIPAANGCNDIIIPNSKTKLDAKVTNSEKPYGYISGKDDIFAPFSLYSSSVTTGYAADVGTNFRTKTAINNYHDDIYGDDKGIPIQGPFTQHHVGGRQHRHININSGTPTTITASRPEAWNLTLASNTLTIGSRTAHQPRATMIRDAYAKRPLNIANLKWGTSSAVAGNYRFGYEILQTSGRSLNNRYFIANGGFSPTSSDTGIFSGAIDYALPRFDLTGTNKSIFVERFNAPGGPEVSSRGCMDVNAEEFSVYNELNYRNLMVREALDSWLTEHCGQFGINPTGSVGDGTNPSQHMTNPMSYEGVVAAYHKVNRNPRETCLVKSGYDRQVNWLKLNGEITFDRTTTIISKPGGASTGWNAGAVGGEKIPRNGYLSFQVTTISDDQLIGLNSNPPAGASYGDMDYALHISATGPGNVYVYQNGDNPHTSTGFAAVGNVFRILRENETVYYQKSTDSGKNFITFYTSLVKSTADLYPDITLYDAAAGVANVKISNPQYDNWFIQHNIPQSTLQYKWITDSYNSNLKQPLGYTYGCHDAGGLVPFSVPNGTTSMTQSTVQFLTQSLWMPYTTPFYVNFAQYSFFNPDRTFAQYYRTQLTESNNTISPGSQFYTDGVIAPTINAYFNNVNGPYGYPSWKQLRAGDTPVPRFHKRNNILSVGSKRGVVTISNGSGTNKPVTYFDPRTGPNNITNYTEPPVTFKFRPLISELTNVQLQHSFGNNKCLWTQRGLPFNNPTQSIGQFLGGLNNKTDAQIYNKLIKSDDYNTDFQSLTYTEVLYPRSANTGLGKTRSRTRYAETASVINVYSPSFPPTASLSVGSNGIDRGPNVRRTFWKKAYYDRNRYLPQFAPASASPGYPSFQTTISNSCGNYDGMARSVWAFGAEPIVYNPPSVNEAHEAVTVSSLSGASSFALNNGLDTGELNSINVAKMTGMMGGVTGSIYPTSYLHQLYIKPSASAFYYWLPNLGAEVLYSKAPNNFFWTQWGPWNATSASYIQEILTSVNKGMKWRTNIDAGKDPWYDSYEAYAENIRGLSQTRTILPEFKISDNMEYYVNTAGGDFRAKNDKFLSLVGGNITSSALTHTSPGTLRGFDENFFKEYSFSDFQKYFGTFSADYKLNKIVINCSAVKKLLPYKGFYPQDRTTQLVSLFSGALGSSVEGGALSASATDPEPTTRVQSGSDQLAMQALLQPWFAPGILYNTIKSGIAVDWGVFTGSSIAQDKDAYPGYSYNIRTPNVRFPFKSLLSPLQYIPQSQSDGRHRLLHNAPSYYLTQPNREPPRFPYAEFAPGHPEESITDLYSSAMHNYLAEIPNFFLRGSQLQSMESREAGDIQVEAGKVYVMDVYLEKTNNAPNDELIMVQDYFNGYVSSSLPFFASSSYPTQAKNGGCPYTSGSQFLEIGTVWGQRGEGVTGSFNGKYFGPPYGANKGTYAASSSAWGAHFIPLRDGDPAYAPVTPPYFYGKAKVRLEFSASADDAQSTGGGLGFRWAEVMNRMTMSFKATDDPRRAAWTKFEEPNTTDPYRWANYAYQAMMDVTASLSVKGILTPNPSDKNLSRWVISPYMETPVLDFSSSQAPEYGYGRGMWSGYGEIPQNHKGIFFGIERSSNLFIGTDPATGLDRSVKYRDMTEWFRGAPATTSQARPNVGATAGESLSAAPTNAGNSYALKRKIGQLADTKMISEAIVAIPFSPRRVYANSGRSKTVHTPIIGKYFFTMGGESKQASKNLFRNMRTNKLNSGFAIPGTVMMGGGGPGSDLATWGVDAPVRDTSVSLLAENMEKYILPPELDFNKYSDIEPFVMYMIEFEHQLDHDDLKDIWQGVMPKIAMTPELDSQGLSHEMKSYEFFGGKPLPAQDEIRWMVFKVKKRAATNYWATTKDSSDGAISTGGNAMAYQELMGLKSNSFINPLGYEYSYNWPYDNFSLIELAQIEVGNNFGRKPPPPQSAHEPRRPAAPAAPEASAGDVSATPPQPPPPAGNSLGSDGVEGGRAGASSQDPGHDPNDNSLGGG